MWHAAPDVVVIGKKAPLGSGQCPPCPCPGPTRRSLTGSLEAFLGHRALLGAVSSASGKPQASRLPQKAGW